MGVTLTDILLFGKAQSSDANNGKFVIYRRNILRWGAIGSILDVIVKGVSPISLPDAIANSLEHLKAFGGTEQRNLPDNYIQRQFIYMMDGSYLLTDIVPTYDSRIEMDFQTTSVPAGNVTFFGGRAESSVGRGAQLAKVSSGLVADGFGATTSSRYASNIQPTANTRYKFTFDNQTATLTSGGTTVFTNTFTGTEANGAALAINALNNAGEITSNTAGIYLYSFKVWNAQGELVADYVPAVQKGTVPVVGFYDTVSKTFKTATAGTFTAGADVTVPTPDTPMDIVSNNGVLKVRHQSGLPLGYTQVEYLQSTGTQYIDTGIVPTNADNTRVKFRFALNDTTNGKNQSIGSNSNLNMYAAPSTLKFRTNGIEIKDFDTDWHTVEMSKSSAGKETIFDGVTYTTPAATEEPSNFYLFALKTVNNVYFGKYKLAGAEIYQSGILVRNLIPCKRNSDNVIGMYDIVNDVFYTNAGTGTFTAGNAVSDPVEVYTDGTVETINVHGKNLFDGQWREGVYNTTSGNYTSGVSNRICNVNMIQVKPSTNYTVSCPDYALTSGMRWLFYDANKNFISAITAGTTTITTPANAKYINFYIANNLTIGTAPDLQLERGSTATTYEPYFNGGTATAEMLLKIDDYEDVQEILSGAITRNVGVKVLDGTEDWNLGSTSERPFFLNSSIDGSYALPNTPFCTHFQGVASTIASLDMPDLTIRCGYAGYTKSLYIKYKSLYSGGVDAFKQYLADQYAAGTPVIVVYPLATPTTESVAGQALSIQQGDNVVEITQASLDNLELEAKYKAAVSLTIQEVQDANLDPNVEVTIN